MCVPFILIIPALKRTLLVLIPQTGTVWGPLLRKKKRHALGQMGVTRFGPVVSHGLRS